MQRHVLWLIVLVTVSCNPKSESPAKITLDQIAKEYVALSLAIGLYDDDYVDAYYGPDDWKPADSAEGVDEFPYEEFVWKASKLLHQLEDIDQSKFKAVDKQRHYFLSKQLVAAKTKISMISGKIFKFDKESKYLYDAVAPSHEASYYDQLLAEIDALLPGEGTIQERYESFTNALVIPKEKLDTVFKTAIREARRRTLNYLDLPEEENFKLEYVTGKSWSGYNWYQGNFFSLIQINTDLPIYIDRAIDLASHEGYPGHHIYNVLLEKNLVRDRGWLEFSMYPLFSPQSLIAEGTANFGIEMAFPGGERLQFEKEVLYPLAGLDAELVDRYYEIQAIREQLSYAGNEAARKYLDGEISREEAAAWLEKYNLFSKDRAIQRTRFIDQYRSYVINYNLGKDMVKDYILRNGGSEDDQEKRWELFKKLLSTPQTASMLE